MRRPDPSPGRLVRATVAAASASLAFAVLTPEPATADQTYYVPVSRTWTVSGHGFGHGHGMSQWGAQGAALQGLNYTEISEFYYPHTEWGEVKGKVRVLISADPTSDLQVRARNHLQVRDLDRGQVWNLPRTDGVDRWRLTPIPSGATAVQFHNATGWHRWEIPVGPQAFRGDGQFEANGPLTLLVPGGDDVVGKTYRGILRLVRPYTDATVRDTINVLPMDQYVQGVVPYEMPSSWDQQALRAQAVAARTFAAYERAQNPKRYWQVCDTTSCQVYGGVDAEADSSNQAVQGTAGKILTYQKKPAMTQFSASSGGWTSSGSVPYLPAKKDPYDSVEGNYNHHWSTQVSTEALENAHPEIGRLIDMRVTSRDGNGEWKGRVQQIVLDGSKGKAHLTGDDFRWAYGLKSNWFTIEPTPIIERWRELGGDDSVLGAPKSGEYSLATGSAQDFKHGRIFWNSKTGARDMQGPILKKYKEYGGPDSHLGWPATGMMQAADGGHKVRMQRGMIYTITTVGAHVVFGKILARWGEERAAGGWLGYPISDVTSIEGGLRCKFQHGIISWDRATGEFTIRET
jgi:stage II sporulation protein D